VKSHEFSMLGPGVGGFSQFNEVSLGKLLTELVTAGLLFRNVGQEVVQ